MHLIEARVSSRIAGLRVTLTPLTTFLLLRNSLYLTLVTPENTRSTNKRTLIATMIWLLKLWRKKQLIQWIVIQIQRASWLTSSLQNQRLTQTSFAESLRPVVFLNLGSKLSGSCKSLKLTSAHLSSLKKIYFKVLKYRLTTRFQKKNLKDLEQHLI